MTDRYHSALDGVRFSETDKARISAAVLKKLERRQRVKRILRRTLIPIFSAAALCLIATPFIIALQPAGSAPESPPSDGDPSPAYAFHEEWRMGEYSLTFESAAREGETLVLSAEGTLSSFSFADASALLARETLALDFERSAGESDVTSGELVFYYDLTPSQWANFEGEDITLTLTLEGETVNFIFSYGDLEVTS